MWLPQAVINVVEAAQSAGQSEGPHAASQSCVLVVDDDELVRETVMLALDEAGFVTKGAEDGASALALLECGAHVDALVTDFSMPGMNGLDLIAAVHVRMPRLPAILLTGHLGDIASYQADGPSSESFTVLQKPIRPTRLAAQLAEALSEATA
jgi:DNA-binding NtrC family response regulator